MCDSGVRTPFLFTISVFLHQGRIQYDTDGHSFYEGDWVNNKRHGYGVRRYKSGNVYEGDWANNNRHGQGIMRWVDIDQSYSGQWDNGIQVGGWKTQDNNVLMRSQNEISCNLLTENIHICNRK